VRTGRYRMEKRIAILGIIVEKTESVMKVNDLLHEYREYIIGRMGMPYKEKNLSVISVVLDAPNEIISALSGKLGMLDGVSSKAVYSKK
jgi:putative iron-only hydrogenase system regulator